MATFLHVIIAANTGTTDTSCTERIESDGSIFISTRLWTIASQVGCDASPLHLIVARYWLRIMISLAGTSLEMTEEPGTQPMTLRCQCTKILD